MKFKGPGDFCQNFTVLKINKNQKNTRPKIPTTLDVGIAEPGILDEGRIDGHSGQVVLVGLRRGGRQVVGGEGHAAVRSGANLGPGAWRAPSAGRGPDRHHLDVADGDGAVVGPDGTLGHRVGGGIRRRGQGGVLGEKDEKFEHKSVCYLVNLIIKRFSGSGHEQFLSK